MTSAAPLPEGIRSWRLQTVAANDARSEVGLVLIGDGVGEMSLDGGVSGPQCAYSTTLPADYAWQPADKELIRDDMAAFKLCVEESCLWEPAHPFLYTGAWKTSTSDHEVPVTIGWRVLKLRGSDLLLNGKPYRIRGLAMHQEREKVLRELHDWGCNLLYDPQSHPTPATDTFGPFVTATLPGDPDDAFIAVQDASAARPSLGIWTVPPNFPQESLDQVRKQDPTCIFAQVVGAVLSAPEHAFDAVVAELIIIAGRADAVLQAGRHAPVPWIAAVQTDKEPDKLKKKDWETISKKLSDSFDEEPQCVGWIACGSKDLAFS